MSQPKANIFVDYIPAQLHENKSWEVVYYAKNPFTQKLARKRNRVKPLQSVTLRRKLGQRMVMEINKRLESGWNPFYQNKGTKELTGLITAIEIYLKRIKKEYSDDNLRYDTFRTYNSQITLLKKYINEELVKPEILAYKFDEDFISDYLDYVRYDKGLSAKTRDNYLSFIKTLATFLLSKKYIAANPTINFGKTNKQVKTRITISYEIRETIFEYWENKNPNFLILCLTCYYCLIRRTELTKLRVGDVNLLKSTIYIDAFGSKNKKAAHVTIPNQLKEHLEEHLKDTIKTDFLFSNDNYLPGVKQLSPSKVTKRWALMRTELNLDSNIHWYSLKDSGITDLLRSGVPLISVRDQARHHSSAQTDAYTPKDLRNADQNIQVSNVKFN